MSSFNIEYNTISNTRTRSVYHKGAMDTESNINNNNNNDSESITISSTDDISSKHTQGKLIIHNK